MKFHVHVYKLAAKGEVDLEVDNEEAARSEALKLVKAGKLAMDQEPETAHMAVSCAGNSETEIAQARRVMADVFKEDPDFKRVYIDNIAMLLFDRGWLRRPHDDRNLAAEAVLDLIFEDKR